MLNKECRSFAGFSDGIKKAFWGLTKDEIEQMDSSGEWREKDGSTLDLAGVYRLKICTDTHYVITTETTEGAEEVVEVVEVEDSGITYTTKHLNIVEFAEYEQIKAIRPATKDEINAYNVQLNGSVVECKIDWDNGGQIKIKNQNWNITQYPVGSAIYGYILVYFKYEDNDYHTCEPIMNIWGLDGKWEGIAHRASHAVLAQIKTNLR